MISKQKEQPEHKYQHVNKGGDTMVQRVFPVVKVPPPKFSDFMRKNTPKVGLVSLSHVSTTY